MKDVGASITSGAAPADMHVTGAEPPTDPAPRSSHSAGAAMVICAFALHPLLAVISANAGILPIELLVVARSAAAIVAAAVVVYWITGFAGWTSGARTIWLGGILFLFDCFGALASIGGSRLSSPRAALAYGVLTIAIVTVIVKPWRNSARRLMPIAVVAAVLAIPNLVKPAHALIGPDTWMPVARRLTALPSSTFSGPPARDVYYIVLDAFGRADTLARYYDADLSGLISFLQARGFTVPARSQSNYAQTYLSLASTLNLDYVDPLAEALGDESSDRRPLQHLIDRNALMGLAQRRGYHIIGIGSDYPATRRIAAARTCRCRQWGLRDLEQAALDNTIFGAVPLSNWHASNHRRKVTYEFEAIARAGDEPGPRFVFAHVITPHPPFVFDDGGGDRSPSAHAAGFRDGDQYGGSQREYVEGYRRQSHFVADEVIRLVGHILARPGPSPAIVIHGDHGPGSQLKWEDAAATKLDERMAIFAAYYLPGSDAAVAEDISPINGVRLVANAYFGTSLPRLPDDSFFSTWSQPYRFVAVPRF